MSATAFERLEDAVLDELFPEVDVELRRGRHIGREDGARYNFLVDAAPHLEPFYRRYGCELVHRSDSYFYLLPSGDQLGRRQLSRGEMLVGQALALLYLDPASLTSAGLLDRDALLPRLRNLLGDEALARVLNPHLRKLDERKAAETVRTRTREALRRLAELGFVDLIDGERMRLRPALMRFADPVREHADLGTALAQLVERGEVVLAREPEPGDAEAQEGDEAP